MFYVFRGSIFYKLQQFTLNACKFITYIVSDESARCVAATGYCMEDMTRNLDKIF